MKHVLTKADLPKLPNVPEGASVPRVIHQIMLRGWSAVPADIQENIAALRARNPGWDYRFYDAESAEDFVERAYGTDILDAYRSIDPSYYAARADFLRYLICYSTGGLYLDIKSSADRPLDEVIQPEDTFCLSQWPALRSLGPEAIGTHPAGHPEIAHVKGLEYVNWFILSAPGHPFLAATIEAVLQGIASYDPFVDGVGGHGVLALTGPIAYTLAIEPLRATTRHRYVDFKDDLGLRYSIYGHELSHRKSFGLHYSQMTHPIVKQGKLKSIATRAWFGKVQPMAAKLRGTLSKT